MADSPSGITKEREQRRERVRVRRALLAEARTAESKLAGHLATLSAEIDGLVLAAWEAGALYQEIADELGHPVSWVIRHIGQARARRTA